MAKFAPTDFKPIGFQPADFQPIDFQPLEFEPIDFQDTGFFAELSKGLRRGTATAGAGLLGTAARGIETYALPPYMGGAVRPQEPVAFEPLRTAQQELYEYRQRPELQYTPGSAGGYIGSVLGETIPYMGAALAAGVTTGPLGAALVGFSIEGEEAYNEAIKKGASKDEALFEGTVVGSINAAIEALQISRIIKFSKTGRHSLKGFVSAVRRKATKDIVKSAAALTGQGIKTAIEEGIEEFAQEGVSVTVPAVMRDDYPKKNDGSPDWWAIGDRMGGAFLGGMTAGGILGGAMIGLRGEQQVTPTPQQQVAPEVQAQEQIEQFTMEELTELGFRPELVPIETPATIFQKRQAHQLAREKGLPEDQYRQMAQDVTGMRSMVDMDKEQAYQFIERLQQKEALPLPEEPQLRKAYQVNLDLAEKAKVKKEHKIDIKERKGKELNLVNHWSSARHAMGEMEIASGLPIRQEFSDIVYTANRNKLLAAQIVNQALKEAGTTPFSVAMKKQQNDQIADWLFEEDPDIKTNLWRDMSDRTQVIAQNLHEILQGKAANEAREGIFRIWNEGGPVPPNVPKEQAKTILAEGRQAMADGRLKEWIATQTWGTREFYYMSQHDIANLADSLAKLQMSVIIEEAEPKIGKKPEIYLPELKPRKGKPKRAKGGSVINAVLNHLERLMVANAVADDLKNFWTDVETAKPSQKDIDVLKEFINSALGKRRKVVEPVRYARFFGRLFWRFHFLSPMRSGWFAFRNLMQNIAYGPSQLPLTEWAKSYGNLLKQRLTGAVDPERAAAFARDWKVKISQKRQMFRQFLLQDEGNITRDAGNRAVILMELAGQAATLSDEANRLLAWPVMYDASQRNVNLYDKKKISYNRLSRRLKLETLHLSQQIEMQRLLAQKDYATFNGKYAEFKTENIHFRYETAFRSGAEQTPRGRVLVGLATYPRGVFELAYQNAVKPFMQGIQSKNFNKAYQGLMGLVTLFIGSAIAKKLVWDIAGRHAYGVLETVFRYTPLGPGAGKAQDFFDRIAGVVRTVETDKTPLAGTIDAVMKVAVDNLELFIPLCDVYLNYYENRNDVAGVRLWSLLKEEALRKYIDINQRPFRVTDRTIYEKVKHQIFSGAEYGEE